jgi:hypothetical protein
VEDNIKNWIRERERERERERVKAGGVYLRSGVFFHLERVTCIHVILNPVYTWFRQKKKEK